MSSLRRRRFLPDKSHVRIKRWHSHICLGGTFDENGSRTVSLSVGGASVWGTLSRAPRFDLVPRRLIDWRLIPVINGMSGDARSPGA